MTLTPALSENISKRSFELSTAAFLMERERVCKETFYNNNVHPFLVTVSFYKYFFKTSTLSSFSQGKSKSLRPK